MSKNPLTIHEAQALAKNFAESNGWSDVPNIDKFDHLHEELIEMSQHLRYKDEAERVKFVAENAEIFKDGVGDLLFGLCRLSNQLGVNMEEAFNLTAKDIIGKYKPGKKEYNIIHGEVA